MTIPLQFLAAGALFAGLVGIPAALGGGNAIEHFLEPSFTARAAVVEHAAAGAGSEAKTLSEHAVAGEPTGGGPSAEQRAPGEVAHMSRLGELGLMAFSVLIAVVGI